ncbi:NAD-dependent epimerase/dehydratase family protein, partial [Candidatus Entotheonella palauensis]
MQILMLGGTRFLGCHLVEAALNQGHEVTLFNRGQTHPGWFAQVERLQGDRDGDLSALEGRHWDAVIDTCGYVPRLVRASAELLAARVEHYTFISTASVYADPSRHGMDEESPVGTLEDERLEDVNGNTYGPLKVLCEQAAEAAMPGRVLTIRSGLIVGPFDPSDRFTYWPVRIAQGGEVLAPAGPGKRIELIDVRDLAEWIVRMAGARATGIYNASGAREALTMGY